MNLEYLSMMMDNNKSSGFVGDNTNKGGGRRNYQFWERNSLSIDLWTPDVFTQKVDYINNNPLQEKWRLAEFPEDYKYSSAKFYYSGHDEFGILAHDDGQ